MEAGRVIAENLRTLRAERNLTLGQLSRISGISKAMLAEIEKGGSNPTINTLLKIANGLNVHASDGGTGAGRQHRPQRGHARADRRNGALPDQLLLYHDAHAEF